MSKRIHLGLGPALTTAVIAGIALVASSSAKAETLTFDDLSNYAPVPNGYGGLNWNNFNALNTVQELAYDGPNGYTNGVVSSPNVLYNVDANPASISSPTAFTLNSGEFTAAWNDGLQVLATALNTTTNQFYFQTFTVNTSGPTLETFNWANINEVTFSSYGGTSAGFDGSGEHFALDNLSVSAVPLPAALPMFSAALLGLAGLGANARRKRAA